MSQLISLVTKGIRRNGKLPPQRKEVSWSLRITFSIFIYNILVFVFLKFGFYQWIRPSASATASRKLLVDRKFFIVHMGNCGLGGDASATPAGQQQPYIYEEEKHYFNKKTLLKVILLGDTGVGKTCLIHQFVHRTSSDDYKATIGADFLTKDLVIGSQSVTLQIWDTAGQERFQSLCSAFYRGADCCVIVYDVNTPSSFERLQLWRDHFISQIGLTHPENYPFLIIGNKIDLERRVISREKAEAWCSQQGGIPYFETSAKTAQNVDDAFVAVTKKTLTLLAAQSGL